MINANIKITSKGSGWQDKFTAACSVEMKDISKVHIFYLNGGDKCEIIFYDNMLKMVRKGDTPLDMTFISGKRTACFAGEGALRLDLDCKTSKLEFKEFTHGIKIKLNYTLSDSPVFLDAVIIYNL